VIVQQVEEVARNKVVIDKVVASLNINNGHV
jgi:hypothetical protein